MQKPSCFGTVWIPMLAVSVIDAPVRGGEPLALEVRAYSVRVMERTPFVVGLRVHNPSAQTVMSIFSLSDPTSLVRQSALVVTDSGGLQHTLFRVGGPGVSEVAPSANIPLPPGASIGIDRVFSLMTRLPPTQRQGNGIDAIYRFLEPGTYRAHVEMYAGPTEALTSSEFELTILPAAASDLAARDEVHIRHTDFLEGYDRPLGEGDYDGRKFHGRVDVSKFGELQRILDEHPDSTYAEWVRYWKLYHHGPPEKALQYAREHRDFPLSDNLMLHVAEGLFSRKDFAQARTVVEELLRDFPDGDTSARAVELQQRLSKKP